MTRRSIEMIKNEDYVLLLRSIISCINNGDYYSIKELSHLKLEQIKEDEIKIKKQIKFLQQAFSYKIKYTLILYYRGKIRRIMYLYILMKKTTE